MDAERFARAIEEIDRANADDPNQISVRGELRPKELAHAELATGWVRRLDDDPSEALLLAVRASHAALSESRARFQADLASLPESARALRSPQSPPVRSTEALRTLSAETKRRLLASTSAPLPAQTTN